MPRAVRKALTIAGSDSGGGAGIQADLKTFAALGVYGSSAITAVTAQNTTSVISVYALPLRIVALQIDAVAQDIGADAVKIGMLAKRATVKVVAMKLRAYRFPHIVVDPVMESNSGAALLQPDAVEALKKEIFPLAELITPNIPEAEILLARSLKTPRDMARAARDLLALGPSSVILKGGHAPRGRQIVDLFCDSRGLKEIRGPYIKNPNAHGTGCTFSSAIAAGLAKGLNPYDAASHARAYLTAALQRAFPIGRGVSPLHHFHRWWKT